MKIPIIIEVSGGVLKNVYCQNQEQVLLRLIDWDEPDQTIPANFPCSAWTDLPVELLPQLSQNNADGSWS